MELPVKELPVKITRIFLSLMLVALAGCASPSHKIKSESRDPDWQGGPFKKILVVGVYGDRAVRISSESVFAAELSEKAVVASPSYDLIPNLDALDDEEAVRTALDGTAHEAILTIVTLEAGEFDYEAWQTQYALIRLLGGTGESTRFWQNVDDLSSGAFVLDVALWDAKTLRLVWHATTDSYSHERAAEGVKTLANFMIKALKERGFIKSFETRLDTEKIGYGLVAFVFVKTNELAHGSHIGQELAKVPEVQEVFNVAGEDCYLVKIRTKNTSSLGRILREKIGVIPEVLSTRSTIVMESYKETCSIPIDLDGNGTEPVE